MSRTFHVVSLLLLMSLLNLCTLARGQASRTDVPGGAAAWAKPADKKPDTFPLDPPRELTLGSPRPVSVAPFGFRDAAKCDSSRNMYLRVDAGGGHGDVLEISQDGKSSKAFIPPKPDNLVFTQLRDFSVTASGTVYYLMQHYKNDYAVEVLEFDSNGTVRRTIKPEVPDRFFAESFAVFDDGAFLLKGHVQTGPPHMSEPTEPYMAIFDADGKLRKKLPAQPTSEVPLERGPLPEGAMAIGKDGNAYLIDANEITVISAVGEVVRRMQYTKPAQNLITKGLAFADGLLAVMLIEVDGVHIINRYLVLRAEDGGTVGYYTLPDEAHNPHALCFSRSDGFTFLKVLPQEKKMVLLDAALR